MFKFFSFLNILPKVLPKVVCQQQTVRGLKTNGEYFRRFGYKYTNSYKGGKSKTHSTGS